MPKAISAAKARCAPGGGGGKGAARLTRATLFDVEIGVAARPEQRNRHDPSGFIESKADHRNPFGSPANRAIRITLGRARTPKTMTL